MKELSVQEKAKRYDVVVNEIKNLRDILLKEGVINENGIICDNFNRIFPELKEGEDERIRKCISLCLEECMYKDIIRDYEREECLAWLEKQGEPIPDNKVEPKFRLGDIIRHKKHGFTCKIIAIDTEYRLSDCMGTHLPFDSQDAYELVEQKPEIKYIYTNF